MCVPGVLCVFCVLPVPCVYCRQRGADVVVRAPHADDIERCGMFGARDTQMY